jgi:hypothetical protein
LRAGGSGHGVCAGIEYLAAFDFLDHEIQFVKLLRFSGLGRVSLRYSYPRRGLARMLSRPQSRAPEWAGSVRFSSTFVSSSPGAMQWLYLNRLDRKRFVTRFPQILECLYDCRRLPPGPSD